MTEAEWLACTDPQSLLWFLGDRAGARKLRLFAVACSNRLSDFNDHPDDVIRALDIAELFADGLVSEEELAEAQSRALSSLADYTNWHEASSAAVACATSLRVDASEAAQAVVNYVQGLGPDIWAAEDLAEEKRLQCAALHELFGNPFCPLSVDYLWLAWNDRIVPKLAQAIYQERAFESMPLLADALEEAGCPHGSLLGHCRQPNSHMRGCWALDLILGKQ
jgi:hypothetical protein